MLFKDNTRMQVTKKGETTTCALRIIWDLDPQRAVPLMLSRIFQGDYVSLGKMTLDLNGEHCFFDELPSLDPRKGEKRYAVLPTKGNLHNILIRNWWFNADVMTVRDVAGILQYQEFPAELSFLHQKLREFEPKATDVVFFADEGLYPCLWPTEERVLRVKNKQTLCSLNGSSFFDVSKTSLGVRIMDNGLPILEQEFSNAMAFG